MNELTVLMAEWENAEHTIEYCRSRAAHELRCACEARGLHKRKLALDTGYDLAYVSRVFKGESQPSQRFLLTAMQVLANEVPALERVVD